MNQRYAAYLASDDWRTKRNRKRVGRRCAICGSSSQLDVHHLRYAADLTTIEQKDLRVLCRRCHEIAHELLLSGALVFHNSNHHSRFALTKTAVKKVLGLTGKNLFS